MPNDNSEKVARLAHKILTKTIWPAKLDFQDAMEVVILIAKGLILSNTDDNDPDDRTELVECVQGHFVTALDELNPNADRVYAWLVAPQGLITEPVGFLWSGSAEEGVEVLIGAELDALREELATAEDHVVVTEGVEGIAMTDPDWDGESDLPDVLPGGEFERMIAPQKFVVLHRIIVRGPILVRLEIGSVPDVPFELESVDGDIRRYKPSELDDDAIKKSLVKTGAAVAGESAIAIVPGLEVRLILRNESAVPVKPRVAILVQEESVTR